MQNILTAYESAGRLTARQGGSLDENPYLVGSFAFACWREGWLFEVRQIE